MNIQWKYYRYVWMPGNELITWKTVKYQMDDIASTKTSISITRNSKDTEKNPQKPQRLECWHQKCLKWWLFQINLCWEVNTVTFLHLVSYVNHTSMISPILPISIYAKLTPFYQSLFIVLLPPALTVVIISTMVSLENPSISFNWFKTAACIITRTPPTSTPVLQERRWLLWRSK